MTSQASPGFYARIKLSRPKKTVAKDDNALRFYHYITVKDKATGKTENLPKVYAEGYTTYRYQLEAFVQAVNSGGKDVESIPGWVSGEDSVLNMAAVGEVYKAAGLKIR
ncbi:hypothetical protein BGZ49_005459, partial [Haplosporangium sp. Z 27]